MSDALTCHECGTNLRIDPVGFSMVAHIGGYVCERCPIPAPPAPAVDEESPWGRIETVATLADGITLVSTPSHGGLHLSDERLGAMPEAERTRDSWYEEDCEIAWPILRFASDIGLSETRRASAQAIVDHYGGAFARCRMGHH